MRLTIDPKPLREWLASAPARGRSTLPVLSHVLMRADAGCLSVESSDLTVWEWRRLAAEVQTSGAVCAQHALLSAALGGATGPVTLDWSDGDAHLSVIVAGSGKRASRFRVPVLPADDFPSEDGRGTAYPLALAREHLGSLIDDLAFAAGRHDIRHYLNCLALCPGMAVATDGKRMALQPSAQLQLTRELLLPIGSLEALRRTLNLPEVQLGVLRAEDQPLALLAQSPEVRLRLSLVDGRYPANIASFLPKPRPTDFVLDVDTEALQGACERLKGYALRRTSDKKSTWAPVQWQFVDGELAARASGGEAGGDAEIFLPAHCVQGQADPERRWAAELHYVAEPLRRAPAQVRLRWVEGMAVDKPLVIEAGDIFHNIMPLRL